MLLELTAGGEISAYDHVRAGGPAVLVEGGILAFIGNRARAKFEEESR
jgi:hypothetical protein